MVRRGLAPRRGLNGKGDRDFPQTREDLLLRRVEGDFYVYDPLEGKIVLLNSSAAFVFDLCDGTKSIQEIAHAVADAAGSEVDSVVSQVEKTLERFASTGLFQLEGA